MRLFNLLIESYLKLSIGCSLVEVEKFLMKVSVTRLEVKVE